MAEYEDQKCGQSGTWGRALKASWESGLTKPGIMANFGLSAQEFYHSGTQ
jgi:hypothetical protein